MLRRQGGGKKPQGRRNGVSNGGDGDLLTGAWINDSIKEEITKMEQLKKTADEKKDDSEAQKAFKEQQEKVKSMASAAKMEYIGNQNTQVIMSDFHTVDIGFRSQISFLYTVNR